MPIRPELRHFYRTPEWKAARAACRDRAGDRCEDCGAPNTFLVLRAYRWWTPATLEATVFFARGRINGQEVTALPWNCGKISNTAWFPRHNGMHWSVIQCGAAHLNNVAGDDRPENLAWLCRGCHLRRDRPHHHETRAARKDAARPLLSHQPTPTKEAAL